VRSCVGGAALSRSHSVPGGLDVHLVMDNYATHNTEPIRDCLAERPRWHVHFTPTGASWINQVERIFALITDKQIRRGVHRSTQQLETDIRTSSMLTMPIRNPFDGPNPSTTSSQPSGASAPGPRKSQRFQNRDTSGLSSQRRAPLCEPSSPNPY